MTDFSCTFHAFCLWIFLNSSANIFRDFDSFAQLELTLFFQLDRIKHLIPVVDSSGKLKECSGDRKTIFHRYVSWWWHLNYHYYSIYSIYSITVFSCFFPHYHHISGTGYTVNLIPHAIVLGLLTFGKFFNNFIVFNNFLINKKTHENSHLS